MLQRRNVTNTRRHEARNHSVNFTKLFSADPNRHTLCNTQLTTLLHNPGASRDRKESLMNAKQVALEVALIGFTALTAYAVYQHGYVNFFEEMLTTSLVTITSFVDLSIALGLILLWLWQDARERNISPLPYVILTVALGSVGPLLYLIRREGREASHAASLSTQRA